MENRGDEVPSRSTQSEWVRGGGRLEWIDVARGIGIIAVVAGHVWTRGPVRDAVYSFHMPLFFLLSGFLSRPQPPGRFAVRQLESQMRPYAAFLILLVATDWIIEPLKGNQPIFNRWPKDVLPLLLGGSWLRGPFTIFWFVPCLMMARIMFNTLLVRWPEPLDRKWLIAIVPIVVGAYLIGYVTQASVLGLLSVPMAFVLLWVGAALQRVPWRRWMWLPVLALSFAGLSSLLPTLNMKAADYGLPVLSIASAIASTLLIFRLSTRVAPFGGWIAAVGRASLVIMYVHVAAIHYLSPYFPKPWLLLAALLLPMMVYHVIRASVIGRRIFL
jgi:fucose 4-O-acetylase-like acetyltransferase